MGRRETTEGQRSPDKLGTEADQDEYGEEEYYYDEEDEEEKK